MRWNARPQTRWVLAALTLACSGHLAWTQEAPRVIVTEIKGVPRTTAELPLEAPPIDVRPPSILNLAPAPSELRTPSASVRTSLPPSIAAPAITEPINTPTDVKAVEPLKSVPPVVPTVPTLPDVPSTLPETLPNTEAVPSSDCKTCVTKPESLWAKHPMPFPFPRLGYFTVPSSGPGHYSFADVLHGNTRAKPPAFPYPPFALQPPSFFDADYRYLDNPENQQNDFFDHTKRMHPTPNTMLSVGGQHSYRYMNEGQSRLGPVDNNYSLIRNRVYADFWYKDFVRVYGEFISATTMGQRLPALPIDDNKADILNLFADVKVAELANNPLYVRVGRQELLYGSQRLVSTLDWANTRRNFQGVKGFWHSEKFDFDAFWVNPVTIKNNDLDSPDVNVQFFGAWATWKPKKGTTADLYYLGLLNDNPQRNPYFPPFGPAPRGTQEIHTFGGRLAGNEEQLLYDFEGMLQCGNIYGRTLSAYAWTAALGWEFRSLPCRPQVWLSNEYASGTNNPGGTGNYTTFQQLFPFGHYYFGAIDVVGRQNINDLALQVALYPDNWITVVTQYHNFQLAERRDSLYNAAGRNTRRSPTGAAGRDVGNEIDFLVNFHLSQHQDFLVGYSKLYSGGFIRNTGPDVNPDLFYFMYNFRW